MSASDKSKLDGIASGANRTTVDSALSTTSANPVQNKVVKAALDGKASSTHNHAASQITSGTLSADRIPTLSPTKVASDPVFIVTAANSPTSISGKTVVKPCILVVTGTNPPQIIYDDGK